MTNDAQAASGNAPPAAATPPCADAPLPVEGFQGTPEEIERQWLEQVYRGHGDSLVQFTVRAVVMGSILGGILSLTNLYIGLKAGWLFGVAITACLLSYTIRTGLHNCRKNMGSRFHRPPGGFSLFAAAISATLSPR